MQTKWKLPPVGQEDNYFGDQASCSSRRPSIMACYGNSFHLLSALGLFQAILVLLAAFSCNHPEALAPKPYLAWIKKHQEKLVSKQEKEGISYALAYRPTDLLALREMGSPPSRTAFTALKKEYGEMEYYTLRIQGNQDMMKYGILSEDDYYQRVDYFAFYAQQDIQLIIAQDTLPCAMYHFERNYGTAPYLSLNLGFEVPEESRGDRSVAFYDRVYTGKLILLELAQEELNHIPKLQI